MSGKAKCLWMLPKREYDYIAKAMFTVVYISKDLQR